MPPASRVLGCRRSPGSQSRRVCCAQCGWWERLPCGVQTAGLLLCWVCPHVVIVQINAHSKLAVYFLKFNIVFVILKYLL